MTNEELKRWHADPNNFLNMKINVNGPQVSDVIMRMSEGWYFNCATNKRSDNLMYIIRKDVRYIVLEEDNPFEYGYYILSDKEHDTLIFVLCRAVGSFGMRPFFQWIEISRHYISFNYGEYGNVGFTSFVGIVDICGQTLFHEEADIEDVELPVYPVGAKKAIIDYIDGFCIQIEPNSSPDVLSLDDTSEINFALQKIREDSISKERTIGGIMHIGSDIKQSFNRMPLPDGAENVLQEVLNLWKKGLIRDAIENEYFEDYLPSLSIVQNIDGKAVFRRFAINVDLAPIVNDSKLTLMECVNVVLDDAYENMDRNTRNLMSSYVVWADSDFKGTILEHSAWMINNAVEIIQKTIKNPFVAEWFDVEYSLSKTIRDDAYYNRLHVVIAAADLGGSNILERLFNLHYENISEINMNDMKKELFAGCNQKPVSRRLTSMFGRIDETKSKLEDILMLPKGMLEYMIKDKRGISYIHLFKKPFQDSQEAIEYFKRLDKKSWKFLVDYILYEDDAASDVGCEKFSKALSGLIKIYGHKSWKSYLTHMSSLTYTDWSYVSTKELAGAPVYNYSAGYSLYVEMLLKLPSEVAKNAQWKLKGEALKITMNSTIKMLNDLNEKRFYETFAENYAKINKWLYEDDKYIIVAPKRIEDIAIEGLTLNHCAKEFIWKICSGETMLFFIRKKGKEDTPFFTLEIRDGKIRQCHGACNMNADSYGNGLDDFLKNFCKEKNIPVSLGTQAIRA